MTTVLDWQRTAAEAKAIAAFVVPDLLVAFEKVSEEERRLPVVWYDIRSRQLFPQRLPPDGYGQRPLMPVKVAADNAGALKSLWQVSHLAPSQFSNLYGGPTPLAATLAGGLLAGGAGYGAGWLTEKLLGKNTVERGKLRRLGAVLGGLAGAMPGVYLGAVGWRMNRQQGKPGINAFVEPNVWMGKPDDETFKAAAEENAAFDRFLSAMEEGIDRVLPGLRYAEDMVKSADASGSDHIPMIPVDHFNRVIWQDQQTPAPVRAAVTGIVEGAGAISNSPVVSPWDVGRMAIGMGTGLASGMVVGRVLGALAGLTPQAQRTLQQTGMWAGALQAVTPQVFGLFN